MPSSRTLETVSLFLYSCHSSLSLTLTLSLSLSLCHHIRELTQRLLEVSDQHSKQQVSSSRGGTFFPAGTDSDLAAFAFPTPSPPTTTAPGACVGSKQALLLLLLLLSLQARAAVAAVAVMFLVVGRECCTTFNNSRCNP